MNYVSGTTWWFLSKIWNSPAKSILVMICNKSNSSGLPDEANDNRSLEMIDQALGQAIGVVGGRCLRRRDQIAIGVVTYSLTGFW